LGDRLLALSELRIEVEPWGAEETRDYLRHALDRAGVAESVFGETAIERLHELTLGIPRRISQLAELALLAGAGSQQEVIDGETVEAAFAELGMQGALPAAPAFT
jgi:type II secretory pathway predicted ATPase ExeA